MKKQLPERGRVIKGWPHFMKPWKFWPNVATVVFCSVPDPILGLTELTRVVKSGSRLRLLEHTRAGNELAGVVMDALNPVVVRMMGANINRRTVENVRRGGWQLEKVEDMGMKGVFKLIVARRDAIG